MKGKTLIIYFPEEEIINSVKIKNKPSSVSAEFHQFCKDILEFMLSLEDIIVDRENTGYRGLNGSLYIPFQVVGRESEINVLQVRVSDHPPRLKKEESLIPITLTKPYKRKTYSMVLENSKETIQRFVKEYQPVKSSIYISNRILSGTEEVPNATVIAKALHKYIKNGKIKNLEAVDWSKRGNGATVTTNRIVFDFARYGDKLRINFLESGQPPKYRETKKKTIPEILEQIQKWLVKDFDIA